MENKCPHCGKFPSDPIIKIENTIGISMLISMNPKTFEKQGCYSSGFCKNCNIFYWDSTCMCMGKTCYKCKQPVPGGSYPKEDLPNGIYEYRDWKTTILREYKNGKFVKDIEESERMLVDKNYKLIDPEDDTGPKPFEAYYLKNQ